MPVGPAVARETFDRLEAAIVDADRAARDADDVLAGAVLVPDGAEPPD